ncbi:MAG: YggS family pyridoxal phosphate-dependent enzyme [Pseudomonadota bacterium]
MQDVELIERFHSVQERLATAIKSAGRQAEDVQLIAVSKLHPASAIATVAQAGHVHFGENYVQEALQKLEDLQALPIHWHFIGHIQSKKAKDVAGRFDLIHTIGSEKLADALHKAMLKRAEQGQQATQDILIQVNVGNEPQKSGVTPEDLPALADLIMSVPSLRLQGLMCLPPFFDDGEAARPFFAQLRTLRDELAVRTGLALPHLSMGMSGDFVQAIEEGATLVRVGTDIFGLRS